MDVGEVYRVDASRRTTAANAYVNGLGHSKRVVLYDNLIAGFPRDEVRLVVAHELGHQKHNDLLRGLAWLALVAPAGTFLTQRLAERFGRRDGLGDPPHAGAVVLPAIALAVALSSFAFGTASNVLSRQVESRADAFSLDSPDPAAFVQFERRMALRNISDPDPPGCCTPCSPPIRRRSSESASARPGRGPSRLSRPPSLSSASCASWPHTSGRRRPKASGGRPSGWRGSSARRAAARFGWRRSVPMAATGGHSGC